MLVPPKTYQEAKGESYVTHQNSYILLADFPIPAFFDHARVGSQQGE
jgi:hypothetical protein